MILPLRILLFLFFFPLAAPAQFAVFPTPGLQYGSVYTCYPYPVLCGYSNYSMRYDGDEILCGKTWNRFVQLPYLNDNYYIRVEQGKYYLLINCSFEALIYDFSKGTGDTVLTSDLGPLKVTETGTFTLDNGSVRKKMTLQSLNPFSPGTYTWVDGVGDINRSFFRATDPDGGYEQLICLRDSSGIFYHIGNWNWDIDCDSLLCPVPQPNFDYSCSGQTFQFNNLSKEAHYYFWDFGDGATSTETDPQHTYAEPGCYTVTLKAKTDCLPQEYSGWRRITVDEPVYWKKSPNQPPADFSKIQFLNTQQGWAISNNAIWKTNNGGMQWDSVPYPGPVRPVSDLHFSDFEHGIVQVRKPNSLYYSEILWTDDGVNWTVYALDNNPTITAVERLNDSVAVVAVRFKDIFVTKNGGQNWANVNVPGTVTLITDFAAISGNAVYFAGLNQLSPPYNEFVFGKSPDAINWETLTYPNMTGSEKMSFVNAQKGWLSNGEAIFQTQNGGQSWNLQTYTPVHVDNLQFADSLHGWACGSYTGIYGTYDGGLTWMQQACSRTEENIGTLAVISPERAFVRTQDGLFEFSAEPDTISICATVATSEPAPKPENWYSVHPNPASDILHVKWLRTPPQDFEMIIFNAQGSAVLHFPAANMETISVSHLPSGFYFVQAMSDGKRLGRGEKLIILK